MGIRALFDGTADMVGVVNELTSNRYFDLTNVVATLRSDVFRFLEKASEREQSRLTTTLGAIRSETASEVGDKALHLARVECDLGLRVPDTFVVPNYACIADAYLNLNSRGGVERDRLRARPRRQAYHYVVVDSFLSENHNENHIRLRFKGGGAAPWQRKLRAEVAAEILRRQGFAAMVTGDLTNGWIAGIDRATGAGALTTIGHLLRFLSRLDLWMTEEADVKRRVEEFEDAEKLALRARDDGAGPTAPGVSKG
jgi:hypothetical protein